MSPATDEDRYCLYCGYSLRGLTTPYCPECGLGFDPKDDLTFTRHKWSPIRFWARPPSLWQVLACLLAFSVFMFIRSTPGNPFYVFWYKDWVVHLIDALLMLAGLCLVIDYLARALVARALRSRWASDTPHPRRRRRLLTWSITPLCCLIVGDQLASGGEICDQQTLSRTLRV